MLDSLGSQPPGADPSTGVPLPPTYQGRSAGGGRGIGPAQCGGPIGGTSAGTGTDPICPPARILLRTIGCALGCSAYGPGATSSAPCHPPHAFPRCGFSLAHFTAAAGGLRNSSYTPARASAPLLARWSTAPLRLGGPPFALWAAPAILSRTSRGWPLCCVPLIARPLFGGQV